MSSENLIFPEAASTVAPKVDALYLFLSGLTIFFFLGVLALIVVFSVRYRRRSPDERPPEVRPSLGLEVAVIGGLAAAFMVPFVWGASVYFQLFTPPPDAMEIYCVGRQWMWKFQHQSGHSEINELHVPVGRPVKVLIASEDVIHSLFIPAFRIKQDAVPGRYTQLWFEATKPGRFHIFCAEYCGTKHAGMIGSVVALDATAFQDWLAGGAQGSLAQAGERLFQSFQCGSCHKPDGQGRGPRLEGVFGSKVELADGRVVVADEAYLRESILNPAAKVTAGFEPIMPAFQGVVGEEEVVQLIAYLKALKPPATPGAGAAPGAGEGGR